MTSNERPLTLGGLSEAFAVLVSVLVFKTSEISLAGLVGSIPIRFRFDASLTIPMMKRRRVVRGTEGVSLSRFSDVLPLPKGEVTNSRDQTKSAHVFQQPGIRVLVVASGKTRRSGRLHSGVKIYWFGRQGDLSGLFPLHINGNGRARDCPR